MAVGMAMAERHLARRFNRPGHALFDHHTFVIASDGDLMEGVSNEASSIAGHLKLGKLVVFWDDNHITIDGHTDISFTEDVVARYAALGWHTQSVDDGRDLGALEAAAKAAMADDRPSFIRVRTTIGWPAPHKQDTPGAHGSPLGEDEVRATKEILGWDPDQHFVVPEKLGAEREAVLAAGREHYADWEARLAAWREGAGELAADLDRVLEGRLPEGWDAGLPTFDADPKGVASRAAGHQVLNALGQRLPELVGGSADLAASNKTKIDGAAEFAPDGEGLPRVVHFGIREHAMGAILNGMALHGGVTPFGATFFVFTDYMRPAIRMAALQKLPVRYVWTHDSIGLGEDGPTHQPVEHLASLRAMPGMTLLRPADANETREAWIAAMRRAGPAGLVLSRQNLPTLDRSRYAAADGVHRGAYVLEGDDPELILLATGSEVHLAVAAHEQLLKDGVRSRVVSVPSFALFLEQDQAYQDQVLPPAVTKRVVVEAGTRFGWERLAGSEAGYVTLDHFGASAPAGELFAHFGFTVDHVVEVARGLLK